MSTQIVLRHPETGKYMAVEADGTLNANRDEPRSWERQELLGWVAHGVPMFTNSANNPDGRIYPQREEEWVLLRTLRPFVWLG